GSGIFLVQSFKKLIKRYEKKEKKLLTDFVILKEILLNNIFGIEIDSKAIKVAAFSLYLALLENLDPKTGWWHKTIQFPYLINDPEDKTLKQQGNNLYKRDTISDLSEIKILQNFDLVVGNPPFGTKELTQTITSYCVKEKFAKEMVLPFLSKAISFAPNGKIALIFNTKVLTNTGGNYQNFRHWLFNKNYVEKIYNFSILRNVPEFSGGQLFGSAAGPISIVFYQKEKPENVKATITYIAPKTYIKTDILDGIVIDSSDVKYLPRIECEKKDTKIWKIAMWGSYFDFELIEKINSTFGSLKDFIKENNEIWDCSTGIMADSLKLEFIPEKLIHTQSISRYYTSHKAVISNDKLYRKINEKFIKAPYLLVKEGQENKKYCSSIIENTEYFLNSAFGFSNSGDFRNSKLLCAYINSTFTSYFLSIYTSSRGIERERIKLNELLLLPAIIKNLDYYILENISSLIDQIITIKKSNEQTQDITHLENEIDQIIYNDILKLTEDEQIIIQDTLNFSLDLFEKQAKSPAMFHVENCADYLNRLSKELNDWLEDVDLKISVTTYFINRSCPLYMVKISFGNEQNPIIESKENIYNELKRLDRCLWAEESQNLYFRKKLNYYDGNDVYIIKPNQRRFWSQTAAMEDCNALLVDILKMKS
ncbi:MAG: endonuclease, partial [Cytophagales bacterium]